MSTPTLNYHIEAQRVDAHGSLVRCKRAEIALDADLAGNPDALKPAELLLAAVPACVIKEIERAAPILKFPFRGVEVTVDSVRQDAPPKVESITYEIVVHTGEPKPGCSSCTRP